eukprot:CAMPEP_0174841458 /NCGR_PEP_ID=MMETSP1114-20130205/9326_1 /TAXON_ID=312471 /ORGANISM="Neobodo designis, Strain CCAP 1951/1" /LENGTH=327 /DNA_ID=CAMNT_0016075641 /DNA_START=50 /DNA_END=1030 /DNA_ORIENTATION=+
MEAEVFALVKLIRGARHSSSQDYPPSHWTIGNLRVKDASEFMPPLDIVSKRHPHDPVRIDVWIGSVLVEQWKILPGSTESDATSVSLLARSMLMYLRFSELYTELVHRDDVSVTVGDNAVLADSQKVVWSASADGVTVQVATNPSWRSLVLERDSRHGGGGRATPVDVGSAPRPTPPLAPQANVVGSFGTSPRVGQTAAVGAFVLPTTTTTVVSPAANAAKPTVIPEDLPPLVPVAAGTGDVASPTSAGPRPTRSLPFGIGASTFDLDEENSPSSGGGRFPDPDDAQRRGVAGFLQTVSEFHARPTGASATVSVRAAADEVMQVSLA